MTPNQPRRQVELLRCRCREQSYKPFAPHAITTTSDALTGAFSLQFPNDPASPNYDGPFPDGTYTVEAKATNALGSVTSNAVTFTLKTTKPNRCRRACTSNRRMIRGSSATISPTSASRTSWDGRPMGSTIQLFKRTPL